RDFHVTGVQTCALPILELYPFRKLIEAGVKSVMVGHLNIPALDSTKNHVSSLSKPIVTGLLKEKMGYTGLITTDAMNMKGVADRSEERRVGNECNTGSE